MSAYSRHELDQMNADQHEEETHDPHEAEDALLLADLCKWRAEIWEGHTQASFSLLIVSERGLERFFWSHPQHRNSVSQEQLARLFVYWAGSEDCPAYYELRAEWRDAAQCNLEILQLEKPELFAVKKEGEK